MQGVAFFFEPIFKCKLRKILIPVLLSLLKNNSSFFGVLIFFILRLDKRNEITKIPMNWALITFFEVSFVAFISCQGVEIVHVTS